MLNRQQLFGQKCETIALDFLVDQGYEILETNYRTRLGEIDIIAKEGESIVFVEVKARKGNKYGSPKWALTPGKQRKISMTALGYLKRTKQTKAKARFDVVAITFSGEAPEIEMVRNAFELAFR